MRISVPLAVMAGAALAGVGLFVARDDSGDHGVAPIGVDDPLPADAVIAFVDGEDEPLVVRPGTVIELTWVGSAADGHPPCATLQEFVDGRWIDTHWLGSAFAGGGRSGDAVWGAQTWDRAIEGSDTEIVCPLMDMIGSGPERFRLPLAPPAGPARLCRGDDLCVDLEYED